MSNLEQLLRSLTKEEISKLKLSHFSASERRFIKRKLHYIRTGILKPKELPISTHYLYKLRSVLVSKIITELVGENDFKILSFLYKKNLRSLTIRYLKIADNRTGRLLFGTEKELFYRHLFAFALPWKFADLDDRLLETYAQKYAAARVVPLPGEDLLLKGYLLHYKILSTRLSSEREALTKVLLEFEKQVQHSNNVEAEYIVLRSLISMLRTGKSRNITLAISFADRIVELVKCNPFYFASWYIWSSQLVKSELIMLQGNVEEAYRSYKAVLQSDPIPFLSEAYHAERFFLCCVYTNRFPEAQALLDKNDPQNIWLLQISSPDRQMCLISYHLLQFQIEEASLLISRALQRIDCEFLPQEEFYIRALEVCCAIIQKDYFYAESLIKRHLKFGEYHSKQFRYSLIPGMLRLLQAIIIEVRTGKTLRPSQLKKLETLKSGEDSYLLYTFYLLIYYIRKSAL